MITAILWSALATGTLLIGMAVVWRASQSKLSLLGRELGRLIVSDSRRYPENRTIPGFLILRPYEGLFFTNADALHNEIINLVGITQPPINVT